MDKILAVGECLIDFFGEKYHQTIKEQAVFRKKFGGAPANVAAVAGCLGGRAMLYSEVGKDQFGDYLLDKLHAFHVDTRYVKRVDTATTLAFVSLQAQGERDFIFVPGAGYQMDYRQIISAPHSTASIVHFGGAFALNTERSRESYRHLLMHYQTEAKCVMYDPNYRAVFWSGQEVLFADYARQMASMADIVKLSEEEAMLLTQADSLDRAVQWLRQHLSAVTIITLGADGSRVLSQQFDFSVPAPTVSVVDTTGAGDAFVGALLYYLAADGSYQLDDASYLRKLVAQANRIAAAVCTVRGALAYFEKQ